MIKYKEMIIETDIGNFKCIVYKIKMSKDFKIYCKQISVKINNNHYFVNENLDVFNYDSNKNNNICDMLNENSPIIIHSIRLEKINYRFIVSSFNYVRYNIENFEYELILKFKGGYNE